MKHRILAGLILLTAAPCCAQLSPQGWRPTRPHTPAPLNALPQPMASAVRQVSHSTAASWDELSTSSGHEWHEYDLRAYTDRMRQDPQPQQTVVDWILRETGTEAWFGSAPAVLSASRESLRVFHTPAMHTVVSEIVDRFVRPQATSQVYSVRLITIANPNWRSKAYPRLRPVPVQTHGVEAWLLSREDAAVVLTELRKRADYREHNSPNLLIANGPSHEIARQRPLAYVKTVHLNGDGSLGGHRLETDQVEEGFSMSIGPLLSRDGQSVDAVIRLETSQVERLTSVAIPVPQAGQSRGTVEIQVPQTSRWRLHERFRWPTHEVLLISCGVVAIPDAETSSLPLPLLGARPPRADALVFVEAKGAAMDLSESPAQALRTDGLNFRGRY